MIFGFKKNRTVSELYAFIASLVSLLPDVLNFYTKFRFPNPEYLLFPFSDAHEHTFRKAGLLKPRNQFLMEGGRKGAEKDVFRGAQLWKSKFESWTRWVSEKRITARLLHGILGLGGGGGTGSLIEEVPQILKTLIGVRTVFLWVVCDPLKYLKTWNLYNIGVYSHSYTEDKVGIRKFLLQNIYSRQEMNRVLGKAIPTVSRSILHSADGRFEAGDVERWLPHSNSFVGFYEARLGQEPLDVVGSIRDSILTNTPLVELKCEPIEFLGACDRVMLFTLLNTLKLDTEEFTRDLTEELSRETGIDSQEIIIVPGHFNSDFVFCTGVFPETERNFSLTGVSDVIREAGAWVRREKPAKPRDMIAETVKELQGIEVSSDAVLREFKDLL